jgi:hypothetical protein
LTSISITDNWLMLDTLLNTHMLVKVFHGISVKLLRVLRYKVITFQVLS